VLIWIQISCDLTPFRMMFPDILENNDAFFTVSLYYNTNVRKNSFRKMTLKMKALDRFEMAITLDQSMERDISEDSSPCKYCCENIK